MPKFFAALLIMLDRPT